VTSAKSLEPHNWECDGLDALTGRTTHNDNKKHSACPKNDDFLNELLAGDMHPRCVPCHRIKTDAETELRCSLKRSGGGGSSGDGNGASAKKTTTNTLMAYFSQKPNSN
jgi:hypothetical protein